jgi:hypothetical protein
MTRAVVAAWVAGLALPSLASAQLPPGKDCYIWPPGAKRGQTVEVRLGGSDWTPDVQFLVYDPRVKLEPLGPPGPVLVPEPPFWIGIKSFDNDPRLPREVAARITLPADLPPGPVRWAVANANGAGGGGVFVIGTGDEVTEDEGRKEPQSLPNLPVTVNGRLGRIEEVDRYRFTAVASGLVTADLSARRLGNEFNGVIEVSAGGRRIAEAVDTEGVDPVLTFAVEKGTTYTVAVRDVDHRGYRNFTYRLGLTLGPRVAAAVPACGRVGERRPVEFIGYGLATGAAKLECVTAEVEFPRPIGAAFVYRLETPFGPAPFTLHSTDTAERVERDGPKLPGPCGVTGRIGKRGKRDVYWFAGKKGEVWDIAVHAKRLGSPVDAALMVMTSDGKPLAASDDAGGPNDPRTVVTLPADGEYQVAVADASGKTPDPSFVYRLVIRRPANAFSLKTVGVVNVPIGGKATLTVEAVREGGFNGPIKLKLNGQPDGVSVPKEVIVPAGAPSVAVPLECAKAAGAAATFVTVAGTATVDDRPVSVTAGERVLMATTMKPPFTVKSPEADGTRKAHRGATHLADLVVERADGFAGEIILDMAGAQQRHRQGIRGPAHPVAPTQGKVLYPVTVPEWLETTRTSRIGLVAMAKIPDPKGVPRWVLTAMDGQVTMSIEGALMKLSHDPNELGAACGDPLAVPLKLARSPKLTGAVRVELVVPPELTRLVSAAPLDWPGEKTTAELKLTSRPDPRLVGVWKLAARATATRDGHPVVSVTEFEVAYTSVADGPTALSTVAWISGPVPAVFLGGRVK